MAFVMLALVASWYNRGSPLNVRSSLALAVPMVLLGGLLFYDAVLEFVHPF